MVSPNVNSVARKFQFGGKEITDELGLDIYDFDARHYDPTTGRWLQIDPLAEKFYEWTPYNYAFNNPVRYIDPDGRSAFWVPNGDGTWTAEEGDSAWTLHEDAGISFEKAKEIMANTKKENSSLGNMGTYTDEDGVEKSAVDKGDIVRVTGEASDGFIVIPDDSDIPETTDNLTEESVFGTIKDTAWVSEENKGRVRAAVQLLRVLVDEVDPSPNAVDVADAYKDYKKIKKIDKLDDVKKSSTRTTRDTGSKTNTKKTNTTSEKQQKLKKQASKKAKKTLKKRKRQ